MRHCPLALLIVLVPCLWAPADELRTLGGKAVTGTVTAVDDATIVVDTKDGPASTPLSQVLALDIQPVKGIPAGSKYTDVRLIDDTVLHCQEIAFQGKFVTLKLLSGSDLKLPLASLTWFVRGAEDTPIRKKFEATATQKLRRDRIVILKDGELNTLEGTLGDIDADGKTIPFKSDAAGDIAINIGRVHGMVFFRPEAPAEAATCKVYDTGGNMLSAAKIAYKNKSWELTTTFGVKLPLPEGAIAKLDFNMGKLTYLSDMEPTKVLERSLADLVVKHRKDANLDGETIMIDRRYTKGLSMHAHTELEYDLGGKFKDLKGVLGVDVRTGAESQPLVTIYCDGEKRFSETITAKAPRPINLNVQDVGTLKIVVSSPNILDLHDHVSFAEARVSQ